MAGGKSNHILPAGHNFFCVTVSTYFNWGKIYDIYSPCVFIFSLLRPFNNCFTFADGVLGENIARGKSNHVFPAGHNLSCDSICMFQLGENI
jgi:hypothetical protein